MTTDNDNIQDTDGLDDAQQLYEHFRFVVDAN